jgi:xylulokinase
MQSPSVLTLDFGTSSVKAGVINAGGVLLWSGSQVFPQVPDYDAWETNQWIYALEQLFSQLKRRYAEGLQFPDAVVISGNGPTLVALGSEYRDRRLASWPVLLWMKAPDRRIEGQPSFYLPKVNWMRLENARQFDSAERFISGPEYIAWLISGSEGTISPHDEFTPYIWDSPGLEAYGLDPERFPPMINVGEVMGEVDKQGRELSGLPLGTPVIAGGSDFLMSLLGTGVIEPGLTCDRAGTSEGINYCSAVPVISPELRTLPHIIPGKYNVAGILASTGRMFEWFRSFSHQREISYMEMMQRISDSDRTDSAPWFFPSVHQGRVWDFNGGVFAGLQPDHNSADLGRAVVNAIGFSIRSALEYLDDSGCTVDSMRSCGGQAKNALWCQMKADITGVNIEVPVIKDAELTGCAVLGFVGLGIYADIPSAVRSLVTMESRYEPDPSQAGDVSPQFPCLEGILWLHS